MLFYYYFKSNRVDVFHFNPTGRNDIEPYIEAEAFDSHWLEEVNFDLEFHGSSAYKNLSQTIKGLFRPFYKERENTI